MSTTDRSLIFTITNAHIIPGPAIVTALEKAAESTIAKYNTGVHTEISAATKAKLNGADDDDDDDEEDEVPPMDGALESPMLMDDGERRLSIKPMDRKQSVVSVSTTISKLCAFLARRWELATRGHSDEVVIRLCVQAALCNEAHNKFAVRARDVNASLAVTEA